MFGGIINDAKRTAWPRGAGAENPAFPPALALFTEQVKSESQRCLLGKQ